MYKGAWRNARLPPNRPLNILYGIENAHQRYIRPVFGGRCPISKSLFYRTLPHFALGLLERYLRLDVEGAEHLPRRGPAILLPNHSGFLGLDALLLSHWIFKTQSRIPRIMLHRLWFRARTLELPARRCGFLEASYKEGLAALEKNKLLIVFPEGEEGNFKPTSERYRLKEFRTGFVNMAAKTGAPIVPILIVGAEETNINLGQVRLFKHVLPIPLNGIPLPAKWKIKFLPPIGIKAPAAQTNPSDYAKNIATKVRSQMQAALRREVSKRKFIYLDPIFVSGKVSTRRRFDLDKDIL